MVTGRIKAESLLLQLAATSSQGAFPHVYQMWLVILLLFMNYCFVVSVFRRQRVQHRVEWEAGGIPKLPSPMFLA
jgi:hypothetical protein